MGIAIELLKAPHVGIRDIKEHLSSQLLNDLLIITDRGNPISVNLPYADVLELADIMDELTDLETQSTVQEGRKAIREGARGVAVAQLFSRIAGSRRNRKKNKGKT